MREAYVQIHQRLPKEQVKGQSKPIDKVIPVNVYTAGRRPGRLIKRLGEIELHIIRYIIK